MRLFIKGIGKRVLVTLIVGKAGREMKQKIDDNSRRNEQTDRQSFLATIKTP